MRPLIESFRPRKYVGVDLVEGSGVDVICSADNLLEIFQKNTCDALISTELIEHVQDWKKVVSNFKNVVKPGGIIVITSRSYGYPFHAYPHDFWRYEIEDIQSIFADCKIEKLEKDPELGFFAKMTKPINFVEKDLADHELYSIIVEKRIKQLTSRDLQEFTTREAKKRQQSLLKERVKKPFSLLFRSIVR